MGVDVREARVLERLFLLDHLLCEPMKVQQIDNTLQSSVDVMDLDHSLIDDPPVSLRQTE